jgi:hypothetical protein
MELFPGCLFCLGFGGPNAAAFHKLDERKAVGVDGVDKETYGQRLILYLKSLSSTHYNLI